MGRSTSLTVQAWFSAIETGDIAGGKKLLAEDFVCTGPTTVPLDRNETMAMYKSLAVAFPDLSFHASDFREHGQDVVTTVRMTGTHLKDLVMVLPQVHRVPATGNSIQLPEAHPKFTVDDKGKIAKLELVIPMNGGLDGLLAQLGAEHALTHLTH